MSRPALRPAGPADRAAVERLVGLAYEPYVPIIGRKPAPMLSDYAALIGEGAVTLLESDDAIAGLVVLKPEPDHLLIDNVAVAPHAQGRGYGRILLEFAEAEASRLGLAELRLVTNQAMVRNIALYGHMGFRETGRGGQDGFRRVFMHKPLDHRSAPVLP